MGRYMLFVFEHYYPGGGINDYIMSHNDLTSLIQKTIFVPYICGTKDEGIILTDIPIPKIKYDEAHVLDRFTGIVVAKTKITEDRKLSWEYF